MLDTVVKTRALRRVLQQEDLNFLLTNRIPRITLTRLMGRFSRIENPWLTRLSLAVWRLFTELDLDEAKPCAWRSLREVFTRELREGARVVDPDPAVLASPCDAIVGECGTVRHDRVYQAKGFPYSLRELFGPSQDPSPFEGGTYVTLRLTSAMYHRFHAPADARLAHVTYLSGDTWNVNPIALARVLAAGTQLCVAQNLASAGQRIARAPASQWSTALRATFADKAPTLFLLGRTPA